MADNTTTTVRVCTECGSKKKPFRRGLCPACRSRRDYHADPQRAARARYMRGYYLERKYGLTIAQYDCMLAAQGGGCAICGTTEPGGPKGRMCVDHDHSCCSGSESCGECIRGLLCNPCNVMLAHARDEPRVLVAAIAYLAVHGGESDR